MDERGLVGYEGLVTLIREPLLRPVQIVRQFISNHETQIRRLSAYHRFEGLSRAPRNGGTKKDNQYPYWYNKPYVLAMKVWQICGYKGLKVWNK